MKKLSFLFLLIYLALPNLSAQDIVFTFNAKDASNTIDSIIATKVETGEAAFVEGSNTINMSSFTTGTKLFPSNPVEISVYPNPFENYTQLKFRSNQNDNIKISLVNAAGQVVAEKSQKITPRIYQFNILTKNNGLYILNITGNQTKFSQKIISSKNNQSLNKIEYNGYSSISPIEKSAKIEGGELIHFIVYSGDNITKIADSPTESKTYEVEFYECKDADGKSYPIVQIGEQWWMAENLAYLESVSPPTTGSYTEPYYYVNGYNGTSVSEAKATENFRIYGVLYNSPAAKTACPKGWHLSSDEEWKQLEMFIGMSQSEVDDDGYRGTNEGTKLKTTSGWTNIKGNGTDNYGFSALPGGVRSYFAEFGGLGYYATWWTVTDTGPTMSWTWDRTISGDDYWGVFISRGANTWQIGNSVRCIKDSENSSSQEVPISDFSVSNSSIVKGQSVQFADNSTNNPISWSWDFGDGSNDNIQNPMHTYSETGLFTVRLIAINSYGSDTLTKTDYIEVKDTFDCTLQPAIITWGSVGVIYESDHDNLQMIQNFLRYLGNGKEIDSKIKILYTDNCDPRLSPNYCQLTSNFERLEPFFTMISEIGTIDFANISSVSTDNYSVVIADFCSSLSTASEIIVLKDFLEHGGHALILADNFCKTGDQYTAAIANSVLEPFGIRYTELDEFYAPLQIPEANQSCLLENVNTVDIFRVTPQVIDHSFKAILESPDGIFAAMLLEEESNKSNYINSIEVKESKPFFSTKGGNAIIKNKSITLKSSDTLKMLDCELQLLDFKR